MAAVGSQRELRALETLLDRAERGVGALLVLGGPPGSGKAALLDVAGDRALERGFEVLRDSGA